MIKLIVLSSHSGNDTYANNEDYIENLEIPVLGTI